MNMKNFKKARNLVCSRLLVGALLGVPLFLRVSYSGTPMMAVHAEGGTFTRAEVGANLDEATGTVTIPDGYELIGEKAFAGLTIKKVVIPASVKHIGREAFADCGELVTVEIVGGSMIAGGSMLETIEKAAFSDCTSLRSIHIPRNLNTIGKRAFKNCGNLEYVDMRNAFKLAEIGDEAFFECMALPRLEISINLEKIGISAFENCSSLSEIRGVSLRLKIIRERAFWGCSSLTSAEISYSVEFVGEGAFANCEKLKKLLIVPPDIDGRSIVSGNTEVARPAPDTRCPVAGIGFLY